MVMKKELIKNEKKRINKLVELAYKQYTLF